MEMMENSFEENGKKGVILIADDEPDIRELLSEFLEGEEYSCILASNAYEALEKFKTDKTIDLVMSDIKMPGKSGLELLSEIKDIDSDAMVIMISAVKDIESAIAAMSKGAYDYVAKPFKLTEVGLIAKKAIEKRRLILENKRYQKKLEKMVERRTIELQKALDVLDKTYRYTLKALIAALDARDTDTQGHSLRVVKYTLQLAELVGIQDEEELRTLEHASLLHDIGKIGIPDAILQKPGKLTHQEWEIMKTHPKVGYEILQRIEFPEEASLIVLHHHERYDGSGYPDGLKGKNIPLGSRIFSIADSLDAMTSERPYRKALSFEFAINEIMKFSGTQFDPEIIQTFNKVGLGYWKKKRELFDQQYGGVALFQ
jgi:putative nucleotidyltransferase with HDIG domain